MSDRRAERVVYVDMTDQSLLVQDFPEAWKLIGGRALSATLLLAECDPGCDPLGPENVLVFAPGGLAGSAAPSSGRLSVGCKSPLTGAINEANAGGQAAQHLARLGYRAIVIKGQPRDRGRLFGLQIDRNGVRMKPADEYKGMWNYATCRKLLGAHAPSASAISIGPAGELMLAGASVACTDKGRDRRPTRHAARGGAGAVMGAKGLKWIVIDPAGTRRRHAADASDFATLCKSFSKGYLSSGIDLSTAGGADAAIASASTPQGMGGKRRATAHEHQSEAFDGADVRHRTRTRAVRAPSCQSGCIVRCLVNAHQRTAKHLTAFLETESIGRSDSRGTIDDGKALARLGRLCDELGLDAIETDAAIAVSVQSGDLQATDAAGAHTLLRAIADRDPTALAIVRGGVAARKMHKRLGAPVPAHHTERVLNARPRSATHVAHAGGAGADPTAEPLPKAQADDAAAGGRDAQIAAAIIDSAGFCMFLSPSMESVAEFYSRYIGETVTREQVIELGEQCLRDESLFNRRAGLGAERPSLTCPPAQR